MLMILNKIRDTVGRWICNSNNTILLLLSVMHLLYMHLCIFHLSVPRIFDYLIYLPSICVMIMDVSILYLIICVVTLWHKRISAIASFWITLLWALSNVVYYRFFHQYMPIAAISQVFNLKEGFIPSMGSVFGFSDLYLLLSILVFAYVVRTSKGRKSQSSWKKNLLIILMPIIAYCAKCGTKGIIDEVKMIQGEGLSNFIGITPREQELSIFTNGVFSGQVMYYLATSESIIELSEEQESYVESALLERRKATLIAWNDSLIDKRRAKNLIFVLVESLVSAPIDLVIDGQEVTPALNRLKHSEGAYFNDSVRSNINIGQSSDGQLIYMTGLLPLSSSLTVTLMDNRHVVGLPQLLKDSLDYRCTRITLPTSPAVWNQSTMNIKYGIEQTSASTMPMDQDGFSYLNDHQMFEMAIQEDVQMEENDSPFFNLLLTISMHAPYTNSVDEMFSPTFPINYSEEYIHYLQACHYTDAELGRYLLSLEERQMLDNSILVIASDHHISQELVKMPMEAVDCKYLPFCIAGADIDSASVYQGAMNQLDIYTTLLDMYDIESGWQGLGSSVLHKETYKDYLQTDETQRVSDLIILSDYLKK